MFVWHQWVLTSTCCVWGTRLFNSPSFSHANFNFWVYRYTPLSNKSINHWLVVWNMKFMTFHSVANGKSSQLTFTPSFFRGVAKTTNQIIFLAQHPSYPHIVGWCRGSESKTSITPKLYPWESHETSILVWLEYQDTSIIIPLLFHLHLIWKVQVPPCCSQPPFGFVKTAR